MSAIFINYSMVNSQQNLGGGINRRWTTRKPPEKTHITIFVNLGFSWHFETVTNIRTWIKSHKYWRML